MAIVYYDGSELYCEEIEISVEGLIADGYRIVPFNEIERIVAD